MRLVCLDLDGTLIENSLVEVEGKLTRPQAQVFTEPLLRTEAWEIIHACAENGDRFAIVTNQGGVAWGYHTIAEVQLRIGGTLALLDFFFGRPFTVHIAYNHPKATVPGFKDDERRKPSGKMILEAIDAHIGIGTPSIGLDVLMVGDRPEDEEAARAADVRFVRDVDFFRFS